MRLRRVKTRTGTQVEVKANDYWISLASLEKLDDIDKKYGAKNSSATSVLQVLELGVEGWNDIQEELSHLPIPEPKPHDNENVIAAYAPRSFRDFMLFEEHVVNSSRQYVKRFMPTAYRFARTVEWLTRKPFKLFYPNRLWYKQPIYYFGNHMNFITEGDLIEWPEYTEALDYELELGAVLSKPIFNASTDEANDAIGGYLIINDISARDVQKSEMDSGFGPQRAKHFSNSISSEIVTADEAKPFIENLNGRVSINGKQVSACEASNAQFSLAEAIAFISNGEHLHSGELIGSGTLPGGSGLETGYWVAPGDSLKLEIEGIGSLSNTIAHR